MSQNVTEIDCGDVFGIAQVADVYSQLKAAYESSLKVNLDISKVERIDTAALQLLYSFQRDAAAKGVDVNWVEPSEVFCKAVDILGMGEFYRSPAIN